MLILALGGIIGGLLGGLIWVLIGHFANAEVGYVAWGIGFLVGLGARVGGNFNNRDEGLIDGLLAGFIALASIVGAKYVVFALAVGSAPSDIDAALAQAIAAAPSDDELTSLVANELIDEKVKKGEKIQWPDGVSPLDQYQRQLEKEEFPLPIWKQAEAKFKKLATEQKDALVQKHRQSMESLRAEIRQSMPSFAQMFSPFDFLWIFLAVFTAFRMGSGGSDDD